MRSPRDPLALLATLGDEPVVWETALEPTAATRRLMATLGVLVVVTESTSDPGARGRAAQDYRASVSNAWRRRDRGEEVVVCGDCGCELELLDAAGLGSSTPAAHDPSCPHSPFRAARAAAAETPKEATSVARTRWTRESALASIAAFAAQHGRAPVASDIPQGDLPGQAPATRLFGGWTNMIEAAGYDRPTRGTRRSGLPTRSPSPPGGSETGAGGGAPSPHEQPPARRPDPAAAELALLEAELEQAARRVVLLAARLVAARSTR